jgi:hypothetical protein
MATKPSLPQSFTPADLTGRRTLVTGAGRGIGLAIARRLIAGGARVAIADVDEDGARTAAEELGNGTIALRCDVRSTADVEAAVAAAVAEFGGLDGLVNNAGIEIAKPITELSEDEFTNVFDINVTGLFRCRGWRGDFRRFRFRGHHGSDDGQQTDHPGPDGFHDRSRSIGGHADRALAADAVDRDAVGPVVLVAASRLPPR